jgi:sugar phosphate isomerase/epimerase
MYISLNGTLVTGKVKWPEFAQLASRLGYGGTDVNLNAAMKEGEEATRQLLKELKLQPAVVGLPVEFRKTEEEFQKGMGTLAAAAKFADSIGCPRMGTWIPSWGELPKAEQRALWKRRFQAVSKVLAETNVRLALEFLGPLHLRTRGPHAFIYRMEEMVEFAAECGKNIGVMVDSWHWHHAGATPKDIVAAGGERVVHVQVADAPNLPPEKILDSERLMPGEGIIDFNAFFGALRKVGYDAGVSPEIFGRGLKAMPPEEGARLGLETTRKVMQKAGVL